MTRRSSTAAIALLLAVGVAGCASGSAQPAKSTGSPKPARPSGSPTPANLDAQYAANRDKATDRARHLLGYAIIPPGAKEQTEQPAALSFPPLGMPDQQTYADVVKYYRVPLSVDSSAAFIRSHPPAGFTEQGSAEGGKNQTVGYAWYGPGTNPATLGQLSMELAPRDSSSSYLRVDGGENFDDPRPIKDDLPGLRLRLEAGQPCPASDRGVVGVRNPGIDLSRQFAPAGTPTSGLLCSYSELNGRAFALLSTRILTSAEAGRLSRIAHQVELTHSDGEMSCPDFTGAQILVLDYPGRSTIDIWLRQGLCGTVYNGQVFGGDGPNAAALLTATRPPA